MSPGCRGARYLTTREAAKLTIAGAAKVSTLAHEEPIDLYEIVRQR